MYLPIYLIRNNLLNNNFIYHHITFAGIWNFSLLPFISRNVIIGPIGGGEVPTLNLIFSMFPKNLIKEVIRTATIKIWAYSPFTWISFALSKKIFVSTRETKMHLPAFIKSKINVLPQIGCDKTFTDLSQKSLAARFNNRKLLFAGRILEWKGLKLLLLEFDFCSKEEFEIIIVGHGDDKNILMEYSQDLNLDIKISGLIICPLMLLVKCLKPQLAYYYQVIMIQEV